MKKIRLYSEPVYLFATVLLALAVAMLSATDFGISMIVAPAYLLSARLPVLSFGQAEYVIQAGLFVLFCLVMRRFRVVYLSSFLTCLIYGAILDLWRLLPPFNPAVTTPGSMALPWRIGMFVLGVLLTAFSIALFFRTYLYPQVYDFFVKGVSERYHLKRAVFKTVFDLSCLAAGTAMTLLFFGRFVGIGWGTLVMALCNGTLIGLCGRVLDRFFTVTPLFPRFAAHFALSEAPAQTATAEDTAVTEQEPASRH